MNEDPRAPSAARAKAVEFGLTVIAMGLGAWIAVLALTH
jgi:hypothetical protein